MLHLSTPAPPLTKHIPGRTIYPGAKSLSRPLQKQQTNKKKNTVHPPTTAHLTHLEPHPPNQPHLTSPHLTLIMSISPPTSKHPFPDCRICQSASTTPSTPLISPCACRGTCTYVHAACLEEWITRRMRSGLPLSRALICELCHTVYAHDAHVPSAAYFFIGKGAWKQWAHVAYATLIARRLAAEVRLTVALARDMWKGCPDRKTGGKAALAVMTAAHYALFLAIDIRLLWRAFRNWREGACRIVVRDRRQGE